MNTIYQENPKNNTNGLVANHHPRYMILSVPTANLSKYMGMDQYLLIPFLGE